MAEPQALPPAGPDDPLHSCDLPVGVHQRVLAEIGRGVPVGLLPVPVQLLRPGDIGVRHSLGSSVADRRETSSPLHVEATP